MSAPLPEGWTVGDEQPRIEIDAPRAEEARAEVVMLRGAAGFGLRVRLPSSTPAGTYRGAVRLGRSRRALVVEVPVTASLRLAPSELALAGAPGSELRAGVRATNRGNVPVDLPPSPPVRFLQRSAQPEPRRAFEVRLPGSSGLFARADELAAGSGPGVQVQLAAGAGTLPPGEERELELVVRIDPAATPGVRHVGDWSPTGELFSLVVDVEDGATRPTAEEAT